jgi:hypothetical protein
MKVQSAVGAMRLALAGAVFAGAVALTAGPVQATTYHFSGHPTPTNSGAGNILNYVGRHAPMTFDFTTLDPLDPNLPFASRIAFATSWTASGGSVDSTISSSDPAAKLSTLQFSTDSLGDLLKYNISVTANSSSLNGKQWNYIFANYDRNNVFERAELDTLHFNGVLHYTTLDSALICTNACGDSALGAFSIVKSVASVPEPTTWAVMLAGMGLSGAMLRHRRRDLTAAGSPAAELG